MDFNKIDITKFGNDTHIIGLIVRDYNPNGFGDANIYLPNEVPAPNIQQMRLDSDQWFKLNQQLDICQVNLESGQLISKGRRQLDSKICWVVYRRDKYKCRYCGIDNVPLTVDHIITWESGGPTIKENLLTCCRKCNKTRGNIDYGSWLQHRYYIEKSKYLSPKIQKLNEDLVKTLNSIPRMSVIRNR